MCYLEEISVPIDVTVYIVRKHNYNIQLSYYVSIIYNVHACTDIISLIHLATVFLLQTVLVFLSTPHSFFPIPQVERCVSME